MKEFLSFLKNEPPVKFLEVKQGSHGLETYINPYVYNMEDAYKYMLIAFLEGIVKKLKEKK